MDPNAVFSGGDYAIHVAARRNIPEVVEWLIRSGARVSVTNDLDESPMDVARAMGHTKIVRRLEKECAVEYVSAVVAWPVAKSI